MIMNPEQLFDTAEALINRQTDQLTTEILAHQLKDYLKKQERTACVLSGFVPQAIDNAAQLLSDAGWVVEYQSKTSLQSIIIQTVDSYKKQLAKNVERNYNLACVLGLAILFMSLLSYPYLPFKIAAVLATLTTGAFLWSLPRRARWRQALNEGYQHDFKPIETSYCSFSAHHIVRASNLK